MLHRTRTGKLFWDERKDEIIKLYIEEGMSTIDIAKIYDCAGNTIQYKLKEWNIPKHERYNNKYYFNDHYFDNIDNEHKAYWIGYILADGHISKNKVLMFGCHVQDIDIIEKVKMDFDAEQKIRYNKDGNPILNLKSVHICDRLFDMGFTHNKSYIMDFEKIKSYIPDELLHHFVRGMFDGDGSIRYYNYEYVKGYQYHFGYTGLYEVCDFVKNYLDIKSKIIKERETCAFTIRTVNAALITTIYNKLYYNATIYCERKYQTFQEVLKLIEKENKNRIQGVSFYTYGGLNKWIAQINKDKNHKTIGYYDTKEEAEIARLQYEYDCYGLDAPQSFRFKEYGIGVKL